MKAFRHLLRISRRNVFRNKRRTILTLLILVLGSTGLILVGGFFDSLIDRLKYAFIYSESGHIQVNREGYFERGTIEPFKYLISQASRLQQLIEEEAHVRYSVPRLMLGGILSTDESSIAVAALGVDPVRERRMIGESYPNQSSESLMNADVSARIEEGEELDQNDPYGVVLGTGVTKALGLKVGDSITFLTTRSTGAIDGADFHVRGSFETAIKEVGDRLIKVPLATAQKLIGAEDQAHTLLVVLDGFENIPQTQSNLEAKFKSEGLGLEIVPWERRAQIYWQSRNFLQKVNRTVQAIIAIVFFFSIANTINMALFERMREYGTMMAIGNSRPTIIAMFLLEMTLLGLIGGMLGVVIGVGVSSIVSSVGLLIPAPPPVTPSYFLDVQVLISFRLLLESCLIGVSATILSSLVPAYRASHSRIVQALGYV